MKKDLTELLLAVLSVVTLTLFTAKLASASDGNNTYGFPFTFYTRFGGKRFPPILKNSEMNYVNLLADIGLSFIVGLLFWKIFQFVMSKQQKNS